MFLCENGPEGGPALFGDAVETVIVDEPQALRPALARLDELRAKGLWIAGTVAYEAGLVFEPRLAPLMPTRRDEPLLVFGAFRGPDPGGPMLARAAAEAAEVRLAPFRPRIARADYDAAFARLMAHIAAGDCYQVNLTFPFDGQLVAGSALGVYGALRARQPVGQGAFCALGGPVAISASPELFFDCDAEGRISTRPMKGTAPRDPDPARDAAFAQALRDSEKGRAENLMIVDLLRNDIGRIAEVGSVRVPELFAIESYATVHQMVSRVTGRLGGRPGIAELLPALFPCGSVTGAPKIRAMQIISELEPFPRGLYCGAMGWMAPDGRAAFNVAIRTLRLFAEGRLRLDVGGGVVQDSTAEGEWEEALWKTRFAELPTIPS
ncbi:aminodeoxychorismate synthase component I [Cereibacter azotoformans]|uniref:aminodeoxychorismate synthase component I n=1 Tax=Cereibacter azotoformans TaxID=43057 RepID=UPI000C6E1F82|nr:aminodeoxychorismate synthase component I [Cereibacter azotoformans]